MPKRALVILGAGASHDLMSADDELVSADTNYKPPLTESVFSIQASFQTILDRYPDAGALVESIRIQPKDKSLEAVLREYSDSTSEHRARQFREVPLYIQELFGEISARYAVRQPRNYTHLVNHLLEEFERVAFVTLNYDLFLEKVLQVPSLGGGLHGLDWYVQPQWLLAKLHGSVNWGRRIRAYSESIRADRRTVKSRELNVEGKTQHYLTLIGQTELKDNLEGVIEILENYRYRWLGDVPCYPALVVPVEEKYEFVCPREHVEQLSEFLRECKNILVIGCSGKDQDLLDLLKDCMADCSTFFLVGGAAGDVDQTRLRFLEAVPQLKRAYGPYFQTFTDGFSSFIENQGVERFAQFSRD